MRVEIEGKPIRVLKYIPSQRYAFNVDDGWTTLAISYAGSYVAVGYLDYIEEQYWEEVGWLELLVVTGITAEMILEIKQQNMSSDKILRFLNERRKFHGQSV